MQPLAVRAGEVGHGRRHPLVAAGVRDAGPLEAARRAEADRLVGGKDAVLAGDGEPKGGRGLASQRTAGRCAPSPRSPLRRSTACRAAGVRFGCVLAEAGCGRSAPFRQAHTPSTPPADTWLRQLAAAVQARWGCEPAHQQLKEELGLDHFEGRSRTGLHRPALVTMIAHALLQARRLAQAGRGKESSARRLSPAQPALRQAILVALAQAPARTGQATPATAPAPIRQRSGRQKHQTRARSGGSSACVWTALTYHVRSGGLRHGTVKA